ncbi:MAG: hypothetical protein M3P52_10365 [Actinomycetota bacterium]|nr:hypothetical protein [Actinomycetota bacterium]
MSNAPEGAQLSDDGQWWWDGENWQAVSPEGGGGAEAGGDDRATAKTAEGLPATLEELSEEQRKQVLGEPTVSVEAVDTDETEVLAMQEDGNESGEAMA